MPQITGKEIGPIGYGLMGFTWRKNPPPQEQAFAAMKAALDEGMNFWNGGEFYGPPDANSMTLLEKYFAKYPEDADKVVICIKGAMQVGPKGPRFDGSREGIRLSVDNVLRQLNGRKHLDLFEAARRDPDTPMRVTLAAFQEYMNAGQMGGISLSEVSARTINEAAEAAKELGVKIEACEVELSLWATNVLDNGVAAACAKHDIILVAYSPLGQGILTGQIKKLEDVPPDVRNWPRFSPENFPVNLELAAQVESLAKSKGCTPAQLAIAWTMAVSRRPGMPTIVPIPGSTTVERVRENAGARNVVLTEGDMDEIDATLAKFEIKGGRYPAGIPTDT